MSQSGLAGRWYEDRAPLRHITEDLTREKLSWHLIQAIVVLYSCCRFSSRSEASLLKVIVAAGAIHVPPEAEKTSGVNEPCSISQTLCS